VGSIVEGPHWDVWLRVNSTVNVMGNLRLVGGLLLAQRHELTPCLSSLRHSLCRHSCGDRQPGQAQAAGPPHCRASRQLQVQRHGLYVPLIFALRAQHLHRSRTTRTTAHAHAYRVGGTFVRCGTERGRVGAEWRCECDAGLRLPRLRRDLPPRERVGGQVGAEGRRLRARRVTQQGRGYEPLGRGCAMPWCRAVLTDMWAPRGLAGPEHGVDSDIGPSCGVCSVDHQRLHRYAQRECGGVVPSQC
jgi:hypothetical protein